MKLAVVLIAAALPASAAEFEFCWIGNGGFTLAGRMALPDAALSKTRVTETDVTAFTIRGYLNDNPVGAWSLDMLTPETSWNLNFDPAAMEFVTGGYSTTDRGQQWNANGAVNDCGVPGFGFNSGGGGQDLCVNGTYAVASVIAPDTSFPVYAAGQAPACFGSPRLSQLEIATPSGP